ncbi:predicted protein [Scheffersomyces stipitis CBS 6054]|uniref:DUF833-domain-containing protein n=1 Tax=Scheffersomyces stipitis (strain ATCC 58785 / CBS 6054 / NBRC 10063 / NRRL Y-11545) TaxID=322104 RepID=A3LQT3_PICST|nr:predicted protein [Scheffersomyces stipitis CBS 6054]ABN65260.2 predicted protein [Scheffersomyces stipitis CBS 6054]KAG2734008.1 hypothetical protein G9P44_003533 [Scheffersomyces stipitis]
MCILLSTTEHPDYPFILLSNRDEYFTRPTQAAHFRSFDGTMKILSPLDMARPEHGTWIGVTTSGKVAVLVNYREIDHAHSLSEVSRGILPLDYLCTNKSADKWHRTLESSLSHVTRGKVELSQIGGFSLVYGQLSIDPKTGKLNHLNILSNRGDHGKIHASAKDNSNEEREEKEEADEEEEDDDEEDDLHGDISNKTTFGLSNSLYYEPWKKVKLGEELLHELVEKSKEMKLSQEALVSECFKLLSHNTYDKEVAKQKDFSKKITELRNSIYIPPLETYISPSARLLTAGKYYGTRTQTILLLDRFGYLNYYEKNIHNSDDVDDDNIVFNHYRFNIDQQ